MRRITLRIAQALLLASLAPLPAHVAASGTDEQALTAFVQALIETWQPIAMSQGVVDACAGIDPGGAQGHAIAHQRWREHHRVAAIESDLARLTAEVPLITAQADGIEATLIERGRALIQDNPGWCSRLPDLFESQGFAPVPNLGRARAAIPRPGAADEPARGSELTVRAAAGNSKLIDAPVTPQRAPADPAAGGGLDPTQIEQVIVHQAASGTGTLAFNPHLLLRDGSIYSLHRTGIAPQDLDVSASRREEPRLWGRWQRDGDVLRVESANGRTSNWRGNWWFQVRAARSSERLQGRYRSVSVSGPVTQGGRGMVASVQQFDFQPDGRFRTDRAGIGSSNEVGGTRAGAQASRQDGGRYRIEDYSITLEFDNGETVRQLFYFYPPGRDGMRDSETIGIGTRYFVRQD